MGTLCLLGMDTEASVEETMWFLWDSESGKDVPQDNWSGRGEYDLGLFSQVLDTYEHCALFCPHLSMFEKSKKIFLPITFLQILIKAVVDYTYKNSLWKYRKCAL